MELKINRSELKLVSGDITEQQTECIVNAANGTLLGGGGVDGAIHRAAGDQLLQECKQIRQEILHGEHLPTGDAVITKGYQLNSQYVIHTVGPVWKGGHNREKELLSNCYRNSLMLATEQQVKSISFPSISTGVYRYPIEQASKIALETIIAYLEKHHFEAVHIVLFSEADFNVYKKRLQDIR